MANIEENINIFKRKVFSPSTISARLAEFFDRDLGTLWVEGEISELTFAQSGHAYFSLKEKVGGTEMRLKAVMWKNRRLYANEALSEGQDVLARGRLAVYPPRGEFQLVVDYLEPRGEGALRQAFVKLEAALEAEGFFAFERKRTLPFWPGRVALITSAGSAAASDFCQTACARWPGAQITLVPVLVQGAGSAEEIVQAIKFVNLQGSFDLIVLTRGGGSLADLWSFNERAVVEAVVSSRLPVLAAIGHSTDLTLAEKAADVKAITPTAAAEMLFPDQAACQYHVNLLRSRLGQVMGQELELCQQKLSGSSGRLTRAMEYILTDNKRVLNDFGRSFSVFANRLDTAEQHLSHMRERIMVSINHRLPEMGAQLASLESQLANSVEKKLEYEKGRLSAQVARLKALNPESILERGYALVTLPSGKVLTDAKNARDGQEISIKLAKGNLRAQVKDVL